VCTIEIYDTWDPANPIVYELTTHNDNRPVLRGDDARDDENMQM